MKIILENITNNSDFIIEVMESDINHLSFQPLKMVMFFGGVV